MDLDREWFIESIRDFSLEEIACIYLNSHLRSHSGLPAGRTGKGEEGPALPTTENAPG